MIKPDEHCEAPGSGVAEVRLRFAAAGIALIHYADEFDELHSRLLTWCAGCPIRHREGCESHLRNRAPYTMVEVIADARSMSTEKAILDATGLTTAPSELARQILASLAALDLEPGSPVTDAVVTILQGEAPPDVVLSFLHEPDRELLVQLLRTPRGTDHDEHRGT